MSALNSDLLEEVFPGESEMARLMRAFDWTQTALGPVESWPPSLRTVLHVMLTSQHPMFLWWGKDLTQFYNDGYRPSLGQDRHPVALGAHGREFWQDIWEIIGSQVEGVMERGESTWQEDALVPIFRNGRMEEVYWTYSYSPVLDEHRNIGGTIVICQESTQRVLTERRMDMLRILAARLAAEGQSVAAAWDVATDVISRHDGDFAFALLYAFDHDAHSLRRVGTIGTLPPELAPDVIRPSSGDPDPWNLSAVIETGKGAKIDDVPARVGDVVSGRWPERVQHAVLLPVALGSAEQPYGVIVAGVSPRLGLDAGYRSFLSLVGGQIATAIANTRALEDMRDAAALKDQFLSLVSHELRTPISTVVGNAILLLRRGEALEVHNRAQALEDIASEGQKLQRVIENLLLLTRLEASQRPAFPALSLPDLVLSEIEAFSHRRPDRKIVLTENAFPGSVGGEEMLLRMVLENLIGNADKYSPADQPIEVSLTANVDGDAEIRVRDYGIGIEEAAIENLFMPFFRSSIARQYAAGMGLGLSVCKRIVEAHGGRISASARPEGGSDFVFTIPRS